MTLKDMLHEYAKSQNTERLYDYEVIDIVIQWLEQTGMTLEKAREELKHGH